LVVKILNREMEGSSSDSAEEGSPLLSRSKGVSPHPNLVGKEEEGEAEGWEK
jgi:hypothetical protein